ncbi:MAG: LegC family aminotransferase [Bacteroidia bacterium]|nr:LegC family aminotransferase [Bacteroidia bacterium]
MITLSSPYLNGNEATYISDCLASEWISTSGSYVARFEESVAEFVGEKTAVAMVNGTAVLHISLLLAGVQSGDEVIVPTLTFIAPINAVHYVGAEPVFMDCDDYLNMDVEKLRHFCQTECRVCDYALYNKTSGRRIRAMIPVHVFGAMCRMDELMDIAQEYHLTVVEDATEALGSVITDGRSRGCHAGTVGDFGCYSFNGNKIITTGGGGMLVAKDAADTEHARYLSTQAKDDGLFYTHNEIGYNYRLPALLAAVGVAQMEQLDDIIKRKRLRYMQYVGAIKDIDGLSMMSFPDYCAPNYWFYSLYVDAERYGMSRDELMQVFSGHNIQTRPVWMLNHMQKPYRGCQACMIDKAVDYQQNILNVPCSAGLTDDEFERVVDVLSGKR